MSVLVLAGCSKSDFGDAKRSPSPEVDGSRAYFSDQTAGAINIADSKVALQIYRTDGNGTLTVPVSFSSSVTGLLSSSTGSVTFAAGETEADIEIPVNTDGLDVNVNYPVLVTITDESVTTPYGLDGVRFNAVLPLTWKDAIKIGKYTGSVFNALFGLEQATWNIMYQESEIDGFYRLITPYSPLRDFEGTTLGISEIWEEEMQPGEPFYVVIDARDPAKVTIAEQSLGFDWGYGVFTTGTRDQIAATNAAGVMENGIIRAAMFLYASDPAFGLQSSATIIDVIDLN